MRAFYDGDWRDGARRADRNPFDDSILDEVTDLGPEVLDAAMTGAQQGSEDLLSLTREEHHAIFVRFHRALVEQREGFITLIQREQGKPHSEAAGEYEGAVQSVSVLADNAQLVGPEIEPLCREASVDRRVGFTLRQPHGVVGLLTPAVFPLLFPVIHASYALAAGNSVVLKPARTTPLIALRMVELLLEAGLPPRAIACLPGPGKELGQALCADERLHALICLGRIPTVRAIRHAAAFVPTHLQWGCASSVLVTDGVDVQRVVERLMPASLENAGQSAFAPRWVAATPGVYKVLVDRLAECLREIRLGNPLQPETTMGPVVSRINADRFDRVLREEQGAGAQVVVGGRRQGQLIEPTLLADCRVPGCLLSQREWPMPVIGISRVQSPAQALQALSHQRYHVLSLITKDEEGAVRAAMRLPFENIHVNGIPTWRDGLICVPGSPPRMGRRISEDRIRDMCRQRDVVCH